MISKNMFNLKIKSGDTYIFIQSFQRQISKCPENFRGLKQSGIPLQSREKASTHGVEGAVCSLPIKSARKYTSVRHGIDGIDVSQDGEVILSNFAFKLTDE